MQFYHLKRFILPLLSALLLLCCSSSGGIGGSGFVGQGAVAGHGSIIVNGAVIETSRATIIVEDEIVGIGDDAVKANLDIGKVVTVEGTLYHGSDSYVANRVTYYKNVEGPVESISLIPPTTKEIVVMGQTVILNTVTVFKATAFDTIAVGDVIEISGFRGDAGVIWASFVENTGVFDPNELYEIKGFVANLDTDAKTLEINALTVDYSTAVTAELPGGEPADGIYVVVTGNLNALDGPMQATDIEPGDELGTDNADNIELTGFVTKFVSAFEFTLGRLMVVTDENTVYVDLPVGGIQLGDKLEAEGSLIDGVLFANEVEFWEPDQVEVEGPVTNIVPASNKFTVGSQVVQTDEDTIFEGGTEDDIALGVMLEVKGVPIDIDRTVLLADKVSFE